MKKLTCLLLVLFMLVSMSACGAKQETKDNKDKNNNSTEDFKAPDMDAVFASMKKKLPSDITVFDNERAYDAYGIDPESCKQEIIVSVYDAAATYEIWLIEAQSEDALDDIKELATARLTSMCEQFQSYDANAFALAEKGKIITEGTCLVMIVAENAEELFDIYYDAF